MLLLLLFGRLREEEGERRDRRRGQRSRGPAWSGAHWRRRIRVSEVGRRVRRNCDAGAVHTRRALPMGPGSYCSPRHRMAFDLTYEG